MRLKMNNNPLPEVGGDEGGCLELCACSLLKDECRHPDTAEHTRNRTILILIMFKHVTQETCEKCLHCDRNSNEHNLEPLSRHAMTINIWKVLCETYVISSVFVCVKTYRCVWTNVQSPMGMDCGWCVGVITIALEATYFLNISCLYNWTRCTQVCSYIYR